MKTLKTLFTLLFALSLTTLYAQKAKPFEGVVVYSLNFDDAGLDPASASMMQGKEMVIYMKGDRSRSEMDFGMVKNITISKKNDSSTVLMDMMGQRFAMKMGKEEVKKAEKKPTIVYLNETKDIAGYKCNRAEITDPETGDKLNLYYTKEISGAFNDQIPGLQGFPMEYEMDMNGVKAQVIAKSVKAEKVPDTQFAIPEGYQVTTPEELQKLFMGGGEEK